MAQASGTGKNSSTVAQVAFRGSLPAGAGTVIAPIADSAGGIHERELELAGAIEVHAMHRHAALAADELRYVGQRSGGGEKEQDERPGDECAVID